MQVDDRQAQEQRIYHRKAAEAFEKLVKLPEWKFVTDYLEFRATNLMQSILAPSVGSDGMSIALSAERSKGALQELNALPHYISTIMKNHGEERKSSDYETPDKDVPNVDRTGPQSEGAAAQVPGV